MAKKKKEELKKSINPFIPPLDPFEPQPQSVGTPEQINPIPPKIPSQGIVKTPEFFSPSAVQNIKGSEGGHVQPPPELVRGTSPEIEIAKEQEQLLLEETPKRQELDPMAIMGETIPFVGSAITAGVGIGDFVKRKLGIETQQQKNFNPEDFRNAELAAIAKEEIDRGITLNEAFGAYVEMLPTGDSVLGVSFAKTLEQPSDNAAQVATNIRKIKRQISNIETNARMGYLPVATAQEQIDDMERNIVRLETRLKSLTNASPSLRFNSDLVNTYETEILVVKEKMLQAKLNIIQGKITDPNEMDIFLKEKALETAGLDEFEATGSV